MKLVMLLLGVLAVGTVALVVSVYGYARQGSATHASRLAVSAPVATPNASPSPSPAEPGSVGPSVLVAGPPDAAGVGGSGPVAVAPPSAPQSAPQNEAPPVSGQADSAAAPSSDEHHHAKDHGGGHGKHGRSTGD